MKIPISIHCELDHQNKNNLQIGSRQIVAQSEQSSGSSLAYAGSWTRELALKRASAQFIIQSLCCYVKPLACSKTGALSRDIKEITQCEKSLNWLRKPSHAGCEEENRPRDGVLKTPASKIHLAHNGR